MLIKRSRLPLAHMICIGMLPSFIKIRLYKLMGYKIGQNVSIGAGTAIVGRDVVIGDHTSIGFLSVVRGNRITIGSFVSIGSTTIIDTPQIDIGDGAKINEQVFIGGMEFPESKFVLGKNTIVMQLTYINTARPVEIGDDSGIGGHCILFTHGSWLSQFEGYPVQFAPIKIGKSVWLPWRIFVMPGTDIGDGSVIGANSLVTGTIPEKALAVGSPAKVIRESPKFPAVLDAPAKENILRDIVTEMIRYFRFYSLDCHETIKGYQVVSEQKGFFSSKKQKWNFYVQYTNEDPSTAGDLVDAHFDLVISLIPIDEPTRHKLVARGISWIDLSKKERSLLTNDLIDEVSLFITRYGVRLTRISS